MIFFRSKYLFIPSSVLITLGMLFLLFRGNLKDQQPDVLVQWLSSYISDIPDAEVTHRLGGIKTNAGTAEDYLKQAAAILSDYSEHFSIPDLDGNASDEEIFAYLLQEWHQQHESGQGMSAVLLDRFVKNGFLPDKSTSQSTHFSGLKSLRLIPGHWQPKISPHLLPLHLLPLIGGIAIGAP